MRIAAALLVVSVLVGSGWAANLRTLESLQKQAGKYSVPLSFDSFKSLCACFLPSGEVHAGFVTQFVVSPTAGIQRLAFGCAIPNYIAGSGQATSTVGCSNLNGRWEFVGK